MAHKGFLRVAMNKTTKKGAPFVSALIVKDPADSEGGEWYSIFDAHWFGGTQERPSAYDIREFADKDAPTEVVYEFEERNGFKNITAIRPAAVKWEQEADVPPICTLLADEARDVSVERTMGAVQFVTAAREHAEKMVTQLRAAEEALKA